MIHWIGSSPLSPGPRVVTVGGFDGVHPGHLRVVHEMQRIAYERDLEVLVASFDPHPRALLFGEEERRLTTPAERAGLLKDAGVHHVVTLAFSHEMAAMSPQDFVETILCNQLGARAVVVGHDHRFGRGRSGNIDVLRRLGHEHGFDVVQMEALVQDGDPVSSSRIRDQLSQGHVAEAARLLGRRYSFSGTVVKGAGRGRTIGVPTANLNPSDARKVIPLKGVYAVRVILPGDDTPAPGMMNIGYRPTFDGSGLHLEVNILDWTGDLYGREVRVEFVARIRDEQKFSGPEELVTQLNRDRQRCRALLEDVS